jgi:hypothetical protein
VLSAAQHEALHLIPIGQPEIITTRQREQVSEFQVCIRMTEKLLTRRQWIPVSDRDRLER